MKYTDLGNTVSHSKKMQEQARLAAPAKKKKKLILILAFFLVLVGTAFLFKKNVKSFFNPVTIVGEISTANLKETDGRTNVLILGSDKRTKSKVNNESFLTDTILVASIGRVENNVTMISLPRDLWVTAPSGYSTKLNAVYAYGGADEMTQVVSDVLGIPLHYYVVVNFDLFRDSINSLGGVEVNVERDFVDYYYPVEGKENAPDKERYETVKFTAGKQVMNGDVALKYVRSRKGTNGEDTDFARSKRQQNLIVALKNKALDPSTLIDIEKMKGLYNAYSDNIDTNIDITTGQGFYFLSQQLDFNKVKSIVLDDRSGSNEGGLLIAPEPGGPWGDAYVLIPKVGNFSQLHAYVQRYIFGE